MKPHNMTNNTNTLFRIRTSYKYIIIPSNSTYYIFLRRKLLKNTISK